MKNILFFLFLLPTLAFAQLELPYSVKVVNPKPLDFWYFESDGTPYDNTTEVTTQVLSPIRYRGMTFNVNGVEYWFGSGITDPDLVLKGGTGFWPLTGTASLTGDVNINGNGTADFQMGVTGTQPVDIKLWASNQIELFGNALANITSFGDVTVKSDDNVTTTSTLLLSSGTPAGSLRTTDGVTEGGIITTPSGVNIFGHDINIEGDGGTNNVTIGDTGTELGTFRVRTSGDISLTESVGGASILLSTSGGISLTSFDDLRLGSGSGAFIDLNNNTGQFAHSGTGSNPGLSFPKGSFVNSSNQLTLGNTRTVTITAPTPATASRTWTIPDLSGDMTFVGLTGTQTLTNKTLALGSNTITGTKSQFNTAVTDGDFVYTSNSLGAIITETWPNLTAWTNVGSATFSVASNILTVNGGTPGSASLSNYIRASSYGKSNIEGFIMEGDITVGTINGTSWGVGFGIQSQTAFGSQSIIGSLYLDSTNKGLLKFSLENTTTYDVSSAGKLSINSGDVINLKLTRNKERFILTATNKTTLPASSISITYDYSYDTDFVGSIFTPGSWNYAIYALGGTHTIASGFTIKSNEPVAADCAYIGDSIVSGYFVGASENRAASIITKGYYENWIINGAPGAKIEDINASEIIAHAPQRIVLSVGANNTGESPATVMGRYATLISSLTGYTMGVNLFITTLRPANTVDVTPINDLIRSTYPTSYIDLYYAAWSGTSYTGNSNYISPDGVHYNKKWALVEAEILAQYFQLKPKPTPVNNLSDSYVSYINGKASIGKTNFSPVAKLDVVDAASQARFSTASTGGASITSTDASEGYLAGGARYNAGWIATATSAGLMGTSFGGMYWSTNTGLTPASSFSPTFRMNLTATGLSIGNSTTPATQMLDVTGNILASGTITGSNLSGTNTGDQSLANTSDATSHTVTLTGGTSVQLIEGSNITLTTGGTGSAGTVTIASSGGGGGYTNLTSFVDQTPWRLFYSNTSGDVTELAFGASNTYLKSNGVSAAPTFGVISVPDGSYGAINVASSGTVWDINAATVGITQLSASGTPSASTYLRGDNTWATVSGGSGWATTGTTALTGNTSITGGGSTYNLELGAAATKLGTFNVNSTNAATIDAGPINLVANSSAIQLAGTHIKVPNSTAGGAQPDSFLMYSNDIVAGNAAPHFTTENGDVVKLYKAAAATSAQEIADRLTTLGLLATSTISGGGGGLTYAQVKAMKFK